MAAPLFKLTKKASEYKDRSLPEPALQAFKQLWKQLILEPIMAFPWADRLYVLITDTVNGTADTPWA